MKINPQIGDKIELKIKDKSGSDNILLVDNEILYEKPDKSEPLEKIMQWKLSMPFIKKQISTHKKDSSNLVKNKKVNKLKIKSNEFFIKQDEDFLLLSGKYSGLLLSEIKDISYLKGIFYKDYIVRTNEFNLAVDNQIAVLKDNKKTHGLYFLYDENKKVLYIGRSEIDLCKRMLTSFEIRYEQTKGRIKYVKLILPKTVADTYILEQYLIKLYNPELNEVFNKDDKLTIRIPGLKNLTQTDLLEINYEKFNIHTANSHIVDAYNLLEY